MIFNRKGDQVTSDFVLIQTELSEEIEISFLLESSEVRVSCVQFLFFELK